MAEQEEMQLFAMMNPLELFPAEIWTMILDQVNDMEDALRFFEAFPVLCNLSHGKTFPWIIGGVLPLVLSKYLDFNDICNCRLVSKSWKAAVDTALETHPDRLPFQSSRTTRLTESHFNYQSLPKIQTKARRLLRRTRNVNSLNSNPFPGRYLELLLKDSKGRGCPTSINLRQAAEMLEKFGQYIWYIRFVVQIDSENEYQIHELVHGLLECLSLLPNLKSLKIDTMPSKCDVKIGKQLDVNSLISIPAQLESLDFTGIKGVDTVLCYNLLTSFGNPYKLQKLEILLEHWDAKFGQLFLNLSELHLDCRSFSEEHLPKITDILWEMPSSFSGRLKISNGLIDVNELLQTLAPYQLRIQSLDLQDSTLVERKSLPVTVTVKSVRELKMSDDPDRCYNFLKSLESLEYLSVQPNGIAKRARKKVLPITKQLRSYLYVRQRWLSATYFNIWKELPNLKMLISDDRQFVRECGNKIFYRSYKHKCKD